MPDYEQLIEQVRSWAEARPDVGAVVLVGSAARSVTPADEWSDLDIALFVDDPAPYLQDAAWLDGFGTPLLTLVEQTAVGHSLERRVLFQGGLEADFSLFPVAAIQRLRSDMGVNETLRRGYRVLVDHVGLTPVLARLRPTAPDVDARRLAELASDVWYHALWAAKKLRRGEVWVARSCVDCYLHARLVDLVAIHARAMDPTADTWHGGRFLERWAHEHVVDALWLSLSRDRGDVADAIRRSVDLFDRLSDETASRLGTTISVRRDETRQMLETLLATGDRT
jgi:aminoglycoside 6-adenylyltransferase